MHDATVGRRMENPDTGRSCSSPTCTPATCSASRGADPRTPSAHLVQRDHDLRCDVVDLDEEQTDEEIVAVELEGENVAVLPSHSWKIVESRAAELLDVTERHGVDAAELGSTTFGVEWWLPTRLTDARRPGVLPGED
ncbi:hypothetical protein Ae717Ps2_6348 [Pseudonocardia sp. Ae717_Ps2]|uniref:hypothetical protein n=1 Tax=Pseudonocardia sp. Ae717_Ps2 TaxID=1885573 RepID=UPI00094B2742|nr:hypothetical protein [Pseudonocardia sp. Ae717_Ps2]OLM28452.1 hypothetical protein Ae717Ps2_6348 [Pseudonocardia sp. Ae717_Ps2]